MEPDRPQHDRPAACGIAQQFFPHLHLIELSLPQGKIWHAFQKIPLFNFFYFFKNCLNVKLRKPESVCIFFASFDNIFTTYHTRL